MRSSPFDAPGLAGQPEPGMANRRQGTRRRVLLAGVITYAGGIYDIDCIVRDLSATGARVSYRGSQPIPAHIYLINIRDRIAYEAHVVSRASQELRLSFVRTITGLEGTDPSLAFLNRLWLSRAPR